MILVLAEDYPTTTNKYALAYIHTRNIYYKENGVDITVLSFKANKTYYYEGIKVISKSDFEQYHSRENIKLLISHAPNVKNHLKFIHRNKKNIDNIIMVFHGHEVLKISKYYPKPFKFVKQNAIKRIIRDCYDTVKLLIMRRFITQLMNENKLNLIFVSDWMREHFTLNLKITEKSIDDKSYIIPNGIHSVFLNENYKFNHNNKLGDIIVIRPLDNPKYGIDIVRKIALKYPEFTFHIYGKGDFFKHFSKPDNLTLIEKYFNHAELPEILNKYSAALMPTRLDAQGVMMCEMATYGIPLVTSDIPICKEMLSEFKSVFYINNEKLEIDLNEVINYRQTSNKKNLKFNNEHTVYKEIKLIKELIKGDC